MPSRCIGDGILLNHLLTIKQFSDSLFAIKLSFALFDKCDAYEAMLCEWLFLQRNNF